MLIATSVLKFCLGTNFVTPYTIHTPYIHHTYRHLDHNTSSWPKGPRANKKQHILVNFELWYKCRYSIQYSFQRGIRWFDQIFSILNNYVTVWGPIWHKNSKKWPKIGIWIIEGKNFPCTPGAVWFFDPVTLRVPEYKKGAFLHISTRFQLAIH